MMKKTISLTISSLVGISVLFLFNNCGKGFETMQDEASLASSGTGSTPTTPTVPGTSQTLTPSEYFTQTVLPLYKSKCISCHVTLPRDAVGPPATDNIYKYVPAKNYALVGAVNATNNTLYNKMLGLLSHTGGNLCPGDVKGSVSPCKETKTWILMENPLLADGIAGSINYVTSLGEVRGWAVDPVNRTTAIQVVVYADAPFDQGGTMIGTYMANGAGSGVEDGHVFKFQLPATYSNGAQRKLFAYGKAAATANIIPNTPFTYVAFTGTAAGLATFTNLVLPKLTACMNCHNWSTRELTFPYLVSPTPLEGGTATRNNFIDNTAGMAHAGGNFCPGGKTAEPCASISKWWQDEGLAP